MQSPEGSSKSSGTPAASTKGGALREIVVAIDFTKGSSLIMHRALTQAIAPHNEPDEVAFRDNANAPPARVHLVFVAESNIANVRPPSDLDAPELTGTDMHRLKDFVAHRLADFAKAHPGVTPPSVEIVTETGDPAEKICEVAANLDADLIVLGTHGRTGIKRLLIGSVAEKVVRLAGCPVLVIREKVHNPDT